MLARRARAVLSGDERTFAATMRSASEGFRREKLRWFARMRSLPLATYELVIDDDTYADLSGGLIDPPRADEVHVVAVEEQIALRGFDARPSAENVYLTVARTGSSWSVTDDDDLEGIGLISSRNVWDFGDVEQVRDGPVLVLTQGSVSTARSIARETARASSFVRDRWPLAWNGRVIVVIPRSTKDLGRVLQTTFDLGPFVAFAASSAQRNRGSFELVGHRVFVQPSTFFRNSASFQADTLSHELLHVATRNDAGAWIPAWLDEGVAQVFGERQVPSLPNLASTERSGDFEGEVPEDWMFTLGSRTQIHFSYEASADFVDHLRDRYGARRVARFYDRLGAISPVSFGTPRYHLDRAARAAFGRSFGSLQRSWAATVRRRF